MSLMSLLNVKFVPFPSPHSSQRHFRNEQEVGVTAQTRPLAGVSLAEWPTRSQTQKATGVKARLPGWQFHLFKMVPLSPFVQVFYIHPVS